MISLLQYAKITGSRKPTSRNPYYSYICQNTPTISFEFTDTTGTNQLLTLGQANWYQGLSYDGPGFCNGEYFSRTLEDLLILTSFS